MSNQTKQELKCSTKVCFFSNLAIGKKLGNKLPDYSLTLTKFVNVEAHHKTVARHYASLIL